MIEHHSIPHPCPYCGQLQDSLTNAIGDGGPEAGSYTLCFKCGAICVLGPNLERQKMDPAEFEKIPVELKKKLRKIGNLLKKKTLGAFISGGEESILKMLDTMWEKNAKGPFSENVLRARDHLRSACQILDLLDWVPEEKMKEEPHVSKIRQAVELAKTAMIDIMFEETPEAMYLNRVADQVSKGPYCN